MSALITESLGEQSPGRSLDVVFAHRGGWHQLWFSLQSAEMALRASNLRYCYFIVANGGADTLIPKPMRLLLDDLADRLELVQVENALSPPAARQLGASRGSGELICFSDNHCLFPHDYFLRAVAVMTERSLGMLHSAFRFVSTVASYHYHLTDDFLDSPEVRKPGHPSEPYRCAVSGHGSFFVRRSLWERLGGYWDGFRGYGGEEEFWDMKLWLTGHEVWIDPTLVHRHLPGERSYVRHHSADHFRNVLMSANLIGGEDLARCRFKHLRRVPQAQQFDMHKLFREALERSAEHAAQLQSTLVRSYPEQLQWFTQNGIPF